MNRNTTRRTIKAAGLRKAQKTVISLGKRTFPAGTLGQGHCRSQPFYSSPEATSPQDQQRLLWSLWSLFVYRQQTPASLQTPSCCKKYQTISRCTLISFFFPRPYSNDTSHYHLPALLHQASSCSLSLSSQFSSFPLSS